MKKLLAWVCMIGSVLWCILLFPIAALAVIYGIAAPFSGDDELIFLLFKSLLAFLNCYLIITFGLSLVKTSRWFMQGKDVSREQLKEIRRKRLAQTP